VILFELLTGELPFRGKLSALLRQVIEEPPPSPRSLDDSVPPALESVCLRAMSKRPEDRYATAGDFEADLLEWLRREPPSSRSAPRRAWRSELRRHSRALVLVGLIAVMLVTVGIALFPLLTGPNGPDPSEPVEPTEPTELAGATRPAESPPEPVSAGLRVPEKTPARQRPAS
ncbi:MAG: hypothetical protein NUV77_15105, partial [Thermoguttaceae bacterium]|nr:hypothetical protein [Thermoguttaceae bacterium]